jgi:hypothetical protein
MGLSASFEPQEAEEVSFFFWLLASGFWLLASGF